MSILSDFPDQVIVLKGTRAVCALRGRLAGLQRRMIDEEQTKEFPKYVEDLRLARLGEPRREKRLMELGRDATDHLERMLNDAKSTGEVIDQLGRLYSGEERRRIRSGEYLGRDAIDRTVRNVMEIAANTFRDHPNVDVRPKFSELGNTFVFRVSLATYLLALDWIGRGGASGASPAKLRNDFVDANFATYATYFDGLMTGDAKLRRLHGELRLWLMAIFDCQLPSGLKAVGIEA